MATQNPHSIRNRSSWGVLHRDPARGFGFGVRLDPVGRVIARARATDLSSLNRGSWGGVLFILKWCGVVTLSDKHDSTQVQETGYDPEHGQSGSSRSRNAHTAMNIRHVLAAALLSGCSCQADPTAIFSLIPEVWDSAQACPDFLGLTPDGSRP